MLYNYSDIQSLSAHLSKADGTQAASHCSKGSDILLLTEGLNQILVLLIRRKYYLNKEWLSKEQSDWKEVT
jgi:hypothetical protein